MSLTEGKDGTYYPPFPVLGLATDGGDIVVMAGGGGSTSSKEIPNVVQAFRYDETTGKLQVVASLDTAKRVVVGLSYSRAAGQWLASVQGSCKALTLDVAANSFTELCEWTTETEGKEPSQNVARYAPAGDIIATGGTDTCVRLYGAAKAGAQPALVRELAKNKEVDDLDFSPDGQRIVSVDKSGSARVWDRNSGEQKACIGYQVAGVKGPMFMRTCRFYAGENGDRLLLTAAGGRGPAYMGIFNIDGSKVKETKIDEKPLTSMGIHSNGKLAAICLTTGTKKIYSLPDLRVVKQRKDAHDLPAPCVAFLGAATAVSGSGDRSINFLSATGGGGGGGCFRIMMVFVMLVTLFYLFAHIGIKASLLGEPTGAKTGEL
eukprot:TRINITY_DN16978_c0_g2_i1.p2 TRINITY_DN16978_c0_g2~~TRINITY_DN16978_c0_g2_i1.p2  ORF type:complete len:405 (-),score=95.28 TRINITY_DN16978_c0_g2_i1:64-1191(-)